MTFHVLEYDPQQVPWFFLIEDYRIWNIMKYYDNLWHIYWICNMNIYDSLWISLGRAWNSPRGPAAAQALLCQLQVPQQLWLAGLQDLLLLEGGVHLKIMENHGKTTTFSWFKWAFNGVYWVYRTSWTHPYLWYYLLIIREIHLCNLFWQTLEIECFVASEILLRNSAEIGFEGPWRGQIPRSC
jgi:hypothetical protein